MFYNVYSKINFKKQQKDSKIEMEVNYSQLTHNI